MTEILSQATYTQYIHLYFTNVNRIRFFDPKTLPINKCWWGIKTSTITLCIHGKERNKPTEHIVCDILHKLTPVYVPSNEKKSVKRPLYTCSVENESTCTTDYLYYWEMNYITTSLDNSFVFEIELIKFIVSQINIYRKFPGQWNCEFDFRSFWKLFSFRKNELRNKQSEWAPLHI